MSVTRKNIEERYYVVRYLITTSALFKRGVGRESLVELQDST